MLVVVNIAYIRIFIDYVPGYHFLKAYLNCNVHEILSPHVIKLYFIFWWPVASVAWLASESRLSFYPVLVSPKQDKN